MSKSNIASLFTFFLVMVLGVGYLVTQTLGIKPFANYTTVHMTLDNTNQLQEGTSVLLRGVKVGHVTEVKRGDDNKIDVSLRFEKDHQIPVDTNIEIEQLSAVGEPFVDFMPDSLEGPYLKNGAEIGTKLVQQPLAIPEIFKLISGLFSNIESKELGGITRTLAEGTTGTEASLPNIDAAGKLLAQTINSRMPEIRRMFENTQTYQSDMAWLPKAISDFGPATAKFIDKDVELMGVLDKMMKEGNTPDTLTQVVNPYLLKIAPDVSTLLANLGTISEPLVPVTEALNDVLPKIDVSALLSQALNTVGNDGVNLTVVIPPEK